jgi:hypothetical protein
MSTTLGLVLISWIIPSQLVFGSQSGGILPLAQAEAPKGKPVTIRGKISAIDGQNFKITTSSGDVLVRVPENTRVGGVAVAQLSDIAAGSYVGTTATRQADGNLRALEVHIFPEESRGTGEGHRPWDLTPDSTMTNANVEKVEQTSVEKARRTNVDAQVQGRRRQSFYSARNADRQERARGSLASEAGSRCLYSGGAWG